MRAIISADPFKCRVWNLHDRFASEINEHTCKAEIESISAHGQIVPVLGRRLADDPDYEIELIYGARRLFAARHLKTPLLVELREITDREGLAAMDIENRQREDISPYERGLSYKRWLQNGHFASQDDISRTLNVSASQVSRLLQLAKLPAVVVDAFRSAEEIRENWGLDLIAALDDPERRAATIRAARSLGANSPRLQGRDVIRKLLSFTAHGRKPKAGAHDKVVTGSDGAALFRIRYLHNSVALIFEAEKTSAQSIDRIETALAAILKREPDQVDRKPKRRTDSGKFSPPAAAEFGATRYREPLQTNE
jgi:ParB family chromosome partitioning protein